MKILLRLALLSFSAAGGILAAVHLAGGTAAQETAVAATGAASEGKPGSPIQPTDSSRRQVSREGASSAAKPRAGGSANERANAQASLANTDDHEPIDLQAPAAVRFEPLHPRVASLVSSPPAGPAYGPPSPESVTAAERLLQAAGKWPAGGMAQAPGAGHASGESASLTPLMLKLIEQQAQANQLLQTAQLAQLQGGPRLPGAPAPTGIAPSGVAPLGPPAPASVATPNTLPDAPSPTTSPAPEAIPPGPAASTAPTPAQTPTTASKPAVIAGEGDDRLTVNSRDADVRELLEQLGAQAGLNILASANVKGTISVSLVNVGVDEALDGILKAGGFTSRREGAFTYIGTVDDFTAMERAQDRIGTRVYRPNYINAKELANLLTPLITPTVGKVSVTSPAAVGVAVNNTSAGGDAIAQQDALVVQDYENVLAELDQVVKDLDRRPLQVSIEAMIVSVTLNDENTYGVDFQLLRNKDHVRFGFGSPANALNNTFQGGFKFAFLDDSLAVFLSALEKVGDTNVVASPKILCLNKQKAEILIGSKLGYISTTVTQNFSTQNVEFLDVGTQLRLRPYISSDGLIRLEVHPELSEGQVVVNGGFTLPQKTLTEVTTNVMCPDGCTVILGGLMRENLRSDSTQTPYLGSLPLVGALFRTKNEKIERTEILVLLTPRIVYDGDIDAEGRLYTDDTLAMENAKYHRMSPVAKAHLARDHADKARVAMRNGNRMLAQRHARLAVHYDPLNRDAVRLLYQIGQSGGTVVSQGLGVETIVGDVGPGDMGPAPPGSPDGELPPWALDDLGQGDMPAAPLHPRDPGIPGQSFDVVRPEVFRDERKQ